MMVKYFRRDFSNITYDDRQRFMNAVKTIYSVDEVPGQTKYGSNFHSSEYFLCKHLTGGGMRDCDHWHDGADMITISQG
jgi:hypothetical protein